MPVTESKLIETSATFGLRSRHSYKQVYRVTTDQVMTPAAVYVGASSASPDAIPVVYTEDIQYPGAIVTSVEMSQINQTRWTVTANFGQLPTGESTSDQGITNPINRPVRYWAEFESYTELITKDNSNVVILNSVGDQFETPIEIEGKRPILVCEKNYASYQDILDIGIEYDKSVNDNTFKGGAARTVLFDGVASPGRQIENGFEYYPGLIRFKYNPDTWDVELVDQGRQYLLAAGGDPVVVRDHTGQPTGEVVLLNPDGTRREQGEIGLFLPPKNVRPLKNFSALGV